MATESLVRLVDVADEFGDGRVHTTVRANVQVRGFPGCDGQLDDAALAALEGTGLLPSRTHELVRNIMVSPPSGVAGDRADLRETSAELDRLICADPALAHLPGRFLFVLDNGRGDLVHRTCDLGLVALDEHVGQLRVGRGWGEVVPLHAAAGRIADLASAFLRARGNGPQAPWHVDELAEPLTPRMDPDRRIPGPAEPPPFGDIPGGRHVPVPEDGLDRATVLELSAEAHELVVTPWHGILIPGVPHD